MMKKYGLTQAGYEFLRAQKTTVLALLKMQSRQTHGA